MGEGERLKQNTGLFWWGRESGWNKTLGYSGGGGGVTETKYWAIMAGEGERLQISLPPNSDMIKPYCSGPGACWNCKCALALLARSYLRLALEGE